MSTTMSQPQPLALDTTHWIKSASDLAALRGPHLLPRSRRRRVRVEIPGVAWEQAKAWETKLNASANACGCSEGATAAIVGAAVGIVSYLVKDAARFGVGIAMVLIATFVAGMIGKSIGLRRAQIRFRRVVAQIEETLASLPSNIVRG